MESTSWHKVKIRTSWRQEVHQAVKSTSCCKKYIMLRIISQEVRKIHHDIKSMSQRQTLRHDVKPYVKYAMTSNNMLLCQKVYHDIKKYVMTSKNATNTPGLQKYAMTSISSESTS